MLVSRVMQRLALILLMVLAGCLLSMSFPALAVKEIKFVPLTYYPTDQPRKIGAIVDIIHTWEKRHPGVKITLVKMPSADYDTWITTQIIGGTAPDIIFKAGAYTIGDKGYMIKLNDYLEQPNKYIRGNKRWKDIFFEQAYVVDASTDGSIYAIAPDLVETAIFYSIGFCGSGKPFERRGQAHVLRTS